jgi:hypothetical protein
MGDQSLHLSLFGLRLEQGDGFSDQNIRHFSLHVKANCGNEANFPTGFLLQHT